MLLILLIAAGCGIFLLSLSIGRYRIPVGDALGSILGLKDDVSPRVKTILFNVRLPRVWGALLSGMALSCSGAAYQSLFRNPLASPDILGAATGASFGTALGILLDKGEPVTQVIAFCMGLAAVSLTAILSRAVGRNQSSIIPLVLSGLVVSGLFSAFISLVKYFADPENQLPAITYWLMGGLSTVTREMVFTAAIIIVTGTVILNQLRWLLNLISFEEDECRSMGVNLLAARIFVIITATLISSAAISLSGPVGWVCLFIPHMTRMLVGCNYRILLPVSTLLGGIYLMLIDDLARNMARVEIPLGILTSLVGAPFFFLVLSRTERNKS
ncbi:MAG: iron ABC transporter permease [Treponema sp.]|nr:iron ABC transporter permease [Treponema sp.]